MTSLLVFLLSWIPVSEVKDRLPKTVSDSIPVSHPVTPLINESSGIVDSKKHKGYLWVEEDSGNPPQLILLKQDGSVVKSVFIKGAVNRDWEDLAYANGYLYIGDIGDNLRIHTSYTIYKIPEPELNTDTVTDVEAITFYYPDGSHDAEAFLVDPVSKDIFIITKRDKLSRIYKLSYPYANTGPNGVTPVGTLNYNGVVSAALSPDRKSVILKTYMALRLYKRNGKESLDKTLLRPPAALPYVMEPQGEAVTFAADGKGYFTLSEKGFAAAVNLFFYPFRK